MNEPSDPNEDRRQEQFLALFLPQQATVRAFLRSIVWDAARCEDVFQETALVLWREFARYDPARPFGAWARGVAAKIALKALRDARRGQAALSPESIQALEAAFAELAQTERPASEREEALRHCLARLPEKTRVLVRLRYEGALTANEIAAKLQSTTNAVQKALSRAREALHRCVEKRLRTA